MAFSKIHKTAEIEVPEGVNEDEVEIIGGACDARGQWDEGVESVVLHTAKKAESRKEGPGEGKAEERQTPEPSKTEGSVTEPPRGRGRGKASDQPADKSTAASTETPAADKPAEPNAETAADKPAEKS